MPTAASQTGRRFVIRNSGTGTITIGRTGAETISGATSQTLAGYGYLEAISNGTNWLVLRGTYADETLGRRIFTWNSAYSSGTGGWQMSYGDTGWRDVSANITSTWTGSLFIRRVNNQISLRASGLKGGALISSPHYSVPSGFTMALTYFIGRETAVVGAAIWGSVDSTALFRGALPSGTYDSGTWQIAYQANSTTTDAWPSSLPGTASGSIPT